MAEDAPTPTSAQAITPAQGKALRISTYLRNSVRWTACGDPTVRRGAAGDGYAATIIPAPTVSFVASSMRMNEPVARLRA